MDTDAGFSICCQFSAHQYHPAGGASTHDHLSLGYCTDSTKSAVRTHPLEKASVSNSYGIDVYRESCGRISESDPVLAKSVLLRIKPSVRYLRGFPAFLQSWVGMDLPCDFRCRCWFYLFYGTKRIMK